MRSDHIRVAMVVGVLEPEGEISGPDSSADAQCEKKGLTRSTVGPEDTCVSTVGLDAETVRAYARNQEQQEQQDWQNTLDFDDS